MKRVTKMYSSNYVPILLLSVIILLSGCGQKTDTQQEQLQTTQVRSPISVDPGIDVLFQQYIDELRGKTIGLVINQTAVDKKGVNIVDRFMEYDDITIKAIFAPEHGYRGDKQGRIEDEIDPVSGATVYSLYGKLYKPLPEMLDGIDVLIFDMQSVGVKFYTYSSTMGHAMQAAAENDVEYWVLDRPNPITGIRVDGTMQDTATVSFVGLYPAPIQYGLTMGELANMVVGEGMMEFPEGFKPRISQLKNWQRDRWYDEIDIPWVKASPNMPDLETAIVYPGMCFFEVRDFWIKGTGGRPFIWLGNPWLDGNKLATDLNELKIPGVDFTPIEFTPTSGNFEGEMLGGIQVNIIDRNILEPVKLGVYVMHTILKNHPDEYELTTKIDRLAGTDRLRLALEEGQTPEQIFESWHQPLAEFEKLRVKYFLYE
ncbi:MAG: DUF1343 domain-containing protein [Bacteroidetes bacterium]|nr:MAG: DUF1343 domain-containing protein [Bacteroidota bacterium]